MEKDSFINEILNSTNEMTKVIPSDALFQEIEYQIWSEKYVSSKTIWLVAASIAVLLLINISLLSNSKDNSQDTTLSSLTSVIEKSNQLYQ